MVRAVDHPQHMKAPYIRLPKLYSLGDFILSQEHTWAFNVILTDQGEGKIVAVSDESFVEAVRGLLLV